jgi:protein ImuA
MGTLIDQLLQQNGIGEMRLLALALRTVAERHMVVLQPPHAPQAFALAALGLPSMSMISLRAVRTGDMMWAAEQVLHSGSRGALLFWADQVGSGSAQYGPVRSV